MSRRERKSEERISRLALAAAIISLISEIIQLVIVLIE